MEIERKFFIKTMPADLSSYEQALIRQAFVSTDPVIRIRQKDEAYFLTVKSVGLLKREESEMPISRDSFMHLSGKTEGLVIEKTRYNLPGPGEFVTELDVFHREYEGLTVAEIEFPDEESARRVTLPSWFGEEVTDDPQFKNSSLSRRTPEEARQWVKQLLQKRV